LNGDAPTSPWRHDPVERVVKQVSEIARHSTFIYFSVDVLAPAMMLRFAELIIERRIQVFWGAEIRLEKYWSPEKCATLKRSGCVAVSVGFESGSDRVLGLIDKGTSVEQTRVTIRNLHGAGIGVQMMGFTGFPGETPGEAMESVEFLRSMRDCWTFGGLGSFDLTPGAIVAKEPGRFGVHDVRPVEGQDIHRTLVFSTDSDWDETQMQQIRTEKLKLQRAEFDRPWAGGTDTAHSYFYHQRYSTRVLAAMELKRTSTTHPGHMYELNGKVVHLRPGLTVDAYPQTAVPRIRRLSPGEAVHVPFVRADGAIFALPLSAADWLLTVGSREAGSMGNAKYAKWLRGALDSDVLRIASAGQRSKPALSQSP
ncbi:MAG: B12-binding domain-containing radical SAM protein, partial [Acidimicrobiia bacterium]